MSDNFASLLAPARAGDEQALARLLTWVERRGPNSLAELTAAQLAGPMASHKMAFRVGITGPPGSGKSTLIGELLGQLMSESGLRVAVLAIDPTSPFSQGAILGDRIRYAEHATGGRVFVRSLGTRGSLGGLSSAAYLMLRAFDLCEFDLVLIETVGVGQVEVEVMNVADHVGLVLVPESGDSIQAMKAGIMEIADFFVINKSDRPGAEAIQREIQAALSLQDRPVIQEVFLTSALRSEGVKPIQEYLARVRVSGDWRAQRSSAQRLREEAKALLRSELESEAHARVQKISTVQDLAQFFIEKGY